MTETRDYAFYSEGMRPTGLGIILVLIRRVLRRLQRPWFFRQEQIFNDLRHSIDVQDAKIADAREVLGETNRLLQELRTEVHKREAQAWDQTAIARRLAALEDSLLDPAGPDPVPSEQGSG
jgi:hypothetical protein